MYNQCKKGDILISHYFLSLGDHIVMELNPNHTKMMKNFIIFRKFCQAQPKLQLAQAGLSWLYFRNPQPPTQPPPPTPTL